MPSLQELISIARNPEFDNSAPVEVRNNKEEFDAIVDPSFGARVLASAGVYLEEFSEDTVESFAKSMDHEATPEVSVSYDNRFMEAAQDKFLADRAKYEDCSEEDLSFLN